MNPHASVMLELLIFVITVILTTTIVLFLVQTGVIGVQTNEQGESERAGQEVSILNAEFLPLGREGTLGINEFQWCNFVNERYQCVGEKGGENDNFVLGEEVHFRFVVESSTVNGELMLVENYRLLEPTGNVILDFGQRNDFTVNLYSSKKSELVTFKDYFIIEPGSESGSYTLELSVKNPLLNTQARITQKIMVREEFG